MPEPEITLDELETYMYCGEYFRVYKEGKIPIYEDRNPLDVVLTAGIRWLINYKAKTNLLPTEDDIVIAVAKMISRAKSHGYEIAWTQDINNINLTLLNLRQFLNTKVIESWNQIEMFNLFPEKHYVNTNLMLNMPLIMADEITFFSEKSYRRTMERPQFLLPLIKLYQEDRIQEKIISISVINKGQFTNYYVNLNRFDLDKALAFWRDMILGIDLKIYKPIFECSKTSCPNYNECRPY